MRRIMQRLFIGSALVCLLALVPRVAAAHRLNVFAYVEGSDVVVEAYFSDSRVARGAVVEAYDAAGSVVVTVETGADGTCRFPVPDVAGGLRVVASTGEGHRGEYSMTAEELGGAPPSSGDASAGVSAVTPATDSAAGTRPSGGRDCDEIAVRLDRIEAALRNVHRQLAELRRPRAGPSFERVLAGLGCIVGMTGAAMFVAAAHKTRRAARFCSGSTTRAG
ncbi:MAG: hypothetical protein JW889_13960 [Verrucomicrobia bacterium]|nr:hypothetical protein [Verrucomicrobiota bacterium]